MESSYIGPNDQDSRQYRSTQLSSSTTQTRRTNNIYSSQLSKTLLESHSPYKTLPLQIVDEGLPQPTSLVSSSTPRQSAPLSALSQNDLDWTFGQGKEIQASTPLLRLEAPGSPPSEQVPPRSPRQSTANMSAMSIQQYDSRFDAALAGIRQSYTWPNFDMNINQQFFSPMPSPALSSSMTQFDEPKLMPMYARSLSSSPPRGNLTPEQRELKKQRDSARRDSKTRLRRERSTSNPYIVSQHASPALLPGGLPEFTNSLSASPLLSQPSPALPSADFLTPFPGQINDGTVPDLYAPVYGLGPNDFATPAYSMPMPYTDPIPNLQAQSFVPRQHSLSSASENHLYHPQPQLHTSAKLESGEHVRVVHSRPKPQCWDHGCNGRQFSTFSNLLRHQREKSGAAAKSSCPNCGAEFTRTTARNGHMAHEKCKQRRNS